MERQSRCVSNGGGPERHRTVKLDLTGKIRSIKGDLPYPDKLQRGMGDRLLNLKFYT